MKPENKPTNKVTIAAVVGAVVVILVWCIGLAGVEVPPEIAVAFSTVLSFAASWVMPDA